jgi:hypothetical protein
MAAYIVGTVCRVHTVVSIGCVRELVSRKVVSADGVHLTVVMNKLSAVSLCHRLMEEEDESWVEQESVGSSKRMRME